MTAKIKTVTRSAVWLISLMFISACVSYKPGQPQNSLHESQTGVVYFESTDNYGFIRDTSPNPIVVVGNLDVPLNHNGNVVITSHGSGGKRNHQAHWEEFLRDHGFATFSLNHFWPREVKSTIHAQIRVTEQQMASDIVHAARLLDSDSRFSAGKIFHLGWSKGGIAGLAAAIEYDGATASKNDLLINGYVEFYPYCGLTGKLFSNAKILILHGKEDNWALFESCQKLVATMKEAGSEIRIEGFEGAYHGFDYWVADTYTIPTALAIRNVSPECTLFYSRDKPLISITGEHTIGDYSSRLAFLKRCASRRVTVGGSPKYREVVENMMLEFLWAEG